VETGDVGQNEQASLNFTRTRRLPRVTGEMPETAKRWAKTWKRATSGENEQASLNLTRTRTLPRVTGETPETAKRWANTWK
jgi:hypothetical protein